MKTVDGRPATFAEVLAWLAAPGNLRPEADVDGDETDYWGYSVHLREIHFRRSG